MSGTLDKTSCSLLWENTAGLKVNAVALMDGAETLAGTVTRPPNGTYSYMYADMDPEISAKYKITITGSSGTDGVYFTSANTYRKNAQMTTTAADYGIAVDDMQNFTLTDGCDPDFSNLQIGEAGILSA